MRKDLTLLFLSVVLGIVAIPRPSEAKQIYFGSETEVVTLAYGGATLLRFPGEVRTISQANRFEISPANGDSPNYSLLSVRPRFSTGSSDVVFILSDGTTIKTRLVVVSKAIPEKTDAIYEFRSRDSAVSNEGGSGERIGAALSELELMRAMLRGDEVSGYDIKNVSRSLFPGFKGVSTRLVRLYTGNQFNGYIFELANTTRNQKLLINIQNLTLGEPNVAILSSVDRAVLDPHGKGEDKTFLRIVAKPTSIYNQLVLPVQVVEKKEASQ